MKKITSLLILNFLLAVAGINFSSAQTPVLFGTCSQGGPANGGTIFHPPLHATNPHALHSFALPDALSPSRQTPPPSHPHLPAVTSFAARSHTCPLSHYDSLAR